MMEIISELHRTAESTAFMSHIEIFMGRSDDGVQQIEVVPQFCHFSALKAAGVVQSEPAVTNNSQRCETHRKSSGCHFTSQNIQ